jgi:hypothetical protein
MRIRRSRRLRETWIAALLALASAGVRAEPLDFIATLSFEGDLAPVAVVTATGIAQVFTTGTGMAHITSLTLPADLLGTQRQKLSTSFALTNLPFTSLVLTLEPSIASATLQRSSGVLAGSLPMPGFMRLCLVGTCSFVVFPRTAGGGTTTAITPLLGTSALYASDFGVFGSNSLQIATWNTGSVSATVNGVPITTLNGTVRATGFVHGPVSNLSSTALPGGVLQLVTPLSVRGVAFGTDYELPLFARLELRFPEPGVVLALTCGAALLLALEGLRRRR